MVPVGVSLVRNMAFTLSTSSMLDVAVVSDEGSVGGCVTFNLLPFTQSLSFLGAIIFECVANFGFLLGRQFQMRRELLPILKEIISNSGDVSIANWSI